MQANLQASKKIIFFRIWRRIRAERRLGEMMKEQKAQGKRTTCKRIPEMLPGRGCVDLIFTISQG
jgi:hypothetical protein